MSWTADVRDASPRRQQTANSRHWEMAREWRLSALVRTLSPSNPELIRARANRKIQRQAYNWDQYNHVLRVIKWPRAHISIDLSPF